MNTDEFSDRTLLEFLQKNRVGSSGTESQNGHRYPNFPMHPPATTAMRESQPTAALGSTEVINIEVLTIRSPEEHGERFVGMIMPLAVERQSVLRPA